MCCGVTEGAIFLPWHLPQAPHHYVSILTLVHCRSVSLARVNEGLCGQNHHTYRTLYAPVICDTRHETLQKAALLRRNAKQLEPTRQSNLLQQPSHMHACHATRRERPTRHLLTRWDALAEQKLGRFVGVVVAVVLHQIVGLRREARADLAIKVLEEILSMMEREERRQAYGWGVE